MFLHKSALKSRTPSNYPTPILKKVFGVQTWLHYTISKDQIKFSIHRCDVCKLLSATSDNVVYPAMTHLNWTKVTDATARKRNGLLSKACLRKICHYGRTGTWTAKTGQRIRRRYLLDSTEPLQGPVLLPQFVEAMFHSKALLSSRVRGKSYWYFVPKASLRHQFWSCWLSRPSIMLPYGMQNCV